MEHKVIDLQTRRKNTQLTVTEGEPAAIIPLVMKSAEHTRMDQVAETLAPLLQELDPHAQQLSVEDIQTLYDAAQIALEDGDSLDQARTRCRRSLARYATTQLSLIIAKSE